MGRFLAVLHARNMEFIRDRASLSWNIIFPAMLIIGFAFMFSGQPRPHYKVAMLSAPQPAMAFTALDYVQYIDFADTEKALNKLRHHQVDLVLDGAARRYWINSQSPDGYLVEKILKGTGGGDYQRGQVSGEEIRYVDWVLPGILGLNMMFSCLFGVGYVIVRYRKSGYLKRLKATPLSAVQFLAAQMVSRLLLIQAITIVVFVGCDLVIDFTMEGSYLTLLLISIIGATCMISLGLVMAARLSSEELAGGLVNMVTWPMMLLSGVWFSLEGVHESLQKLALALPLTHIVSAARAVMTEGASLGAIAPHLAVLAVMSVAFLALGAAIFRWE